MVCDVREPRPRISSPLVRAGLLYALIAVALVSPALMPGKALSMADQLRVSEPWRSASPPPFERPALPYDENSDGTIQLQAREH